MKVMTMLYNHIKKNIVPISKTVSWGWSIVETCLCCFKGSRPWKKEEAQSLLLSKLAALVFQPCCALRGGAIGSGDCGLALLCRDNEHNVPPWRSHTSLYIYCREVFFLTRKFWPGCLMSRSHGENVLLILHIWNMPSNVPMLGSSVATQKLPLPFATQMKYDAI